MDVLSKERLIKQNKNALEFLQTNFGHFPQAHLSGSIRVQSAKWC